MGPSFVCGGTRLEELSGTQLIVSITLFRRARAAFEKLGFFARGITGTPSTLSVDESAIGVA
jgi:hypothetical protein